jgi:hypothetical protein
VHVWVGILEKKVIISTVAEDMSPLFSSLKDFSVERVHLLVCTSERLIAETTKRDLEKFEIPVRVHDLGRNIWEESFRVIGQIAKLEQENEVVVNVSSGDFNNRCAATCAAFVNGLKAFTYENKELFLLPVMKFSYYSLLTEKKHGLLDIIGEKGEITFEELSKSAKMSLPLVSYHINGNLKSEGLKKLGLVETEDKSGKTSIKLSTLGRMLLNGYVNAEA